MKTTIIILVLILIPISIFGAILTVPDEHETIQEAIDRSENTDTILVSPGEYVENINFDGKRITIASEILLTGDEGFIERTIIDGNAESCVVCFENQEGNASILRGFTIRNGLQSFGGGIDVQENASPLLLDLLITGNEAREYGGGVYCTRNASPRLERVVISGNTAVRGGGIGSAHSAHPELINCQVINNNASDGGGIYGGHEWGEYTLDHVLIAGNVAEAAGGIYLENSRNNVFRNVTISGNEAENIGAVYLYGVGDNLSEAFFTNSIIYGNSDPEIRLWHVNEEENVLRVTYSDIRDGEDGVEVEGGANVVWGDGNIERDPRFIDPDEADYHLSENSPCIDTGNPDAPDDPDGTRADMGAFYYHQNRTLNVPGDFETIQEAIDAAQNGDTVLVQPGRYVENISFEGKGITVASLILTTDDPAYIDSTIIDGDEQDCVVSFDNEEGNDSILRGFTITNGIQDFGGGIDCQPNTSPLLFDLLITNNTANHYGGGIYFSTYAEPRIYRTVIEGNNASYGGGVSTGRPCEVYFEDVIIRGNSASSCGGGVHCESWGHFIFQNVLIQGNVAGNVGGAVFYLSTGTFDRVTISDNRNTVGGGTGALAFTTGEEGSGGSTADLKNCIIWGNDGDQISHYKNSDSEYILTISYCDIEGGEDGIILRGDAELDWGDGNIDSDPLFADPDNADYHLTEDSPCIDAGDPESPEDPDSTRADMGALYYHQRPMIDVRIDSVDFGPVPVGNEVSSTFYIYNPGGIDLVIDSISLGENYLFLNEWIGLIEPGDSLELTVGYAPEQQGIHSTQLAVYSNDPDDCPLNINLNAWAHYGWRYETSGSARFTAGYFRNDRQEVFISDSEDGIIRLDISDPDNPRVVDIAWEDLTPGSLFIDNDRLFALVNNVFGGCLSIFDISSDEIIELCRMETDLAMDIAARDDRMFVLSSIHASSPGGDVPLDAHGVLGIYDISDPENPERIGGDSWAGHARSFDIRNNLIYTAGYSQNMQNPGLIIHNISNPEDPQWIGDYSFPDWGSVHDVQVRENVAFLSDYEQGLFIVDVSNPAEPGLIDFMDVDSSIKNMTLYYDYLYLCQPDVRIQAVDVIQTDNASLSQHFVMPGAERIDIQDDMASVPCGEDGVIFIITTDFLTIETHNPQSPVEFELYCPFPNPFNSTTTITYSLPAASEVSLRVFDLSGREVKLLVEGYVEAGKQTAVFDAGSIPSGVYFIRLNGIDRSVTRKMMLLR